jgi:integrase
VNPCVLKRGELPEKLDKDPTWRAKAVFTRDEIVQVITDLRVPEDRRVMYSLIFLAGGLRFGEAAARRWRDYDPDCEPLGRLAVHTSFNVKTQEEKEVKTKRPRDVPVHPTLAMLLDSWRREGWERMAGRSPEPHDLIVPSRRGVHRNVNHMLKRFHQDLERLGLRRRRQHDLRRTFISLCRADGARMEILRWVTHGPSADIMDDYTSLPWESLCAEVAKLRIRLAEPGSDRSPNSLGSGTLDCCFGTVLGTVAARAVNRQEKSPESQGLRAHASLRGGRDSNLSEAI